MAQDQALQAIIDRAITAGFSDDDIRGLAEEHRARQTSAPPPEATRGVMAQSTMAGDPLPPQSSPTRGFDLMDMDRAVETSRGLRAEALAHPIRTAAMIAAPGIVAKAGRIASPYVGPMLTKAGQWLEQPLVGGGLGAMHGFERGGLGGAVEQGLYGAIGSSVLGRALTAAGTRLTPASPPANAGGRLVPRSTPAAQETLIEGLAATRVPPPVRAVSLPEQGPGPSVMLSPQAQRAAAGRPSRPAPGIVQPASPVIPPRAPAIVAQAPLPVPPPVAAPPPVAGTRPASAGPPSSKSKAAKGEPVLSPTDRQVFAASVRQGLSDEDALAEMLRQRALRHAEKYATHKQAAEARRKAAGQ